MLEIVWSAVPLAICLAMFVWGARVFFYVYRPPADARVLRRRQAVDVEVPAPEGNREIDSCTVRWGRRSR